NVQPTYTQLDTVLESAPLPSSSDFSGIEVNQVQATFKASPEISHRKEVISGQEDAQSNMATLFAISYCLKLLAWILANSRGQGMTSVKEGDLQPYLDKPKVCAIK
ncbi:hypothetical protein ACJMK2_020026, partial [Sinanodonta woodiana]